MASPPGQPLGFSLFSAAPRKKSGELQILREGRPVTLLGAAQAERPLARATSEEACGRGSDRTRP